MTEPAVAAVLFDLDGVLIDSYQVWFSLLNGACSDWGYPAISAEVFDAAWGQGVQADRESLFPRQSVAELEAYYAAHFKDHWSRLETAPEVPAVFAHIAMRGLPTAVITNTPNPLASELVERAGAKPDLVVGGTDVPRAKPAPDMVLHAAERLGVDVARALVVGDSSFDRDAARAAGSRFAGLGIEGDITLKRLDELRAFL
ncbi:MAG: HAD family hydrolase [Deltaproteobacteria bacterium]|nr:HAD family hydrolase [Deltaproteobacteria bacterium]MBW2397160.1 HAD family hydrolase [Deltaproteobacteria bacterium]